MLTNLIKISAQDSSSKLPINLETRFPFHERIVSWLLKCSHAFKTSYNKGKYMKKLKMLQKKHIFQQKPSRNIFKNMSDMDLIFFGDRKTSHGLTLKRLPNPQSTKWWVPSTCSQQVHILPFLELFSPTCWARPKISQHMLTKILENVTHTLKSLNLKYHHHTTPRSVNF